MRRYFPYPLLAVGLAIMWILLAGFSPGQILLAAAMSFGASHALRALGEASPPIHRWLAIPELFGIVLSDIIRSNIAVAKLLLTGDTRPRTAKFITMTIRLRSPSGLAILAIIVTSTPGTAWVDYSSARGELLIHVFDVVDEQEWIDLILNRYEARLMEIFE